MRIIELAQSHEVALHLVHARVWKREFLRGIILAAVGFKPRYGPDQGTMCMGQALSLYYVMVLKVLASFLRFLDYQRPGMLAAGCFYLWLHVGRKAVWFRALGTSVRTSGSSAGRDGTTGALESPLISVVLRMFSGGARRLHRGLVLALFTSLKLTDRRV